ncbi:hypothetical protein OSC52_13405 [Clostridium pasteurianum]|uniref:hypothetical protein n=1 Tax=Clostridium pasteurianum TaxID=1501 RepID=UPI002260B95B|nr:hypothetical protein [Clostridium pasteurianum]UZW12845.1 hypothetical protein OSC52_13405 [Clostridium pasteurianum]
MSNESRNKENRMVMGDKTDKTQNIVNRKKTTCPKVGFKADEEKNTELVLKLLRGYYQVYVK